MFKERFLKIADVIEAYPEMYNQGDYGDQCFVEDVDAFANGCGTPACIAGWAIHLFGEDIDERAGITGYNPASYAAELLGVNGNRRLYTDLFEAYWPEYWREVSSPEDILLHSSFDEGVFESLLEEHTYYDEYDDSTYLNMIVPDAEDAIHVLRVLGGEQ